MGTIGYGAMYPAGEAANVLVVIESITGLLVTALATGLVVAKFGRTTARVAFIDRAPIHSHDGVRRSRCAPATAARTRSSTRTRSPGDERERRPTVRKRSRPRNPARRARRSARRASPHVAEHLLSRRDRLSSREVERSSSPLALEADPGAALPRRSLAPSQAGPRAWLGGLVEARGRRRRPDDRPDRA
jgi:hypothetical protein